ncbi:MAG: hypothetical protein IKM76_12485 [Prevotella sp.]|nr:hypothetical protein [Prevotella sp.]
MKKRLLLLMMTVGALAVHADTYPYMTFITADGTKTSLPAAGLSLAISGSNLVATDGSTSKTFNLTDLSSMHFSAASESSVTGIDAVGATATGEKVSVFTLNGVRMGTYDSVEAARNALPAGVYIIGKKKIVIE